MYIYIYTYRPRRVGSSVTPVDSPRPNPRVFLFNVKGKLAAVGWAGTFLAPHPDPRTPPNGLTDSGAL